MKFVLAFIFVWIGAAAAQEAPSIAQRALRGVIFKPSHDAEDADRAAIKKMMQDMYTPYSGDPDHDFVAHMIPHHQAAVELCQTELQYGADAKIKQLCSHIVSSQQADLRVMQAWLAKHPAKTVHDIPQNIQYK